MKKALYTIFLICILCAFINPVYAEDFNMTLTGDDISNKVVTLNLSINDFTEYDTFYGFTAELEYDSDKLDLSLIKGLNKFDLTYNADKKRIVLYNPNGLKEKKDVLTIMFNIKELAKDESTNVSIINITSSDGKKDIKLNNVTKKITNTSKENIVLKTDDPSLNNNYLSSIQINGKNLDFDKNTLNYDIVVSYNTKKITLTATAEINESIIDGLGEYELMEGTNEIILSVTSPNGLTRSYIINVSRETKEADQTSDALFIKEETKKNSKLLIIIPCIAVAIILLIIILIRKDKKK